MAVVTKRKILDPAGNQILTVELFGFTSPTELPQFIEK
jgi:hypothetical protein